ncbi:ABC transporter permease [Patescibacteria group bacterium]|nr:ABC transporter permease [Patescibacteria group bacterium]
MLINSKRIIKSAIASFWRSRGVSLSAILAVSITLLVFGALIFSNAALDSVLLQIKNKVDVNVFFTTTAPEEEILALKDSLEKMPEVGSVEYVSREDSLENFKKKHEGDQVILQTLEELEGNPLGAVLNIQAKETNQYENIAEFLDSKSTLSIEGTPIIDKINYYQNKIVIDRLTKIIKAVEKIGFALTLILVIMSIVITFNTIRLVIYISREEISVMRLVGASSKYVRGPFVVGGMIYGLISSLITLVAFFPLTFYLGDFSEKIFGMNMFDYYMENFVDIVSMIVLSGIVLGIVSSYLAVRKYLKV